jgi:diguanylate cyclase
LKRRPFQRLDVKKDPNALLRRFVISSVISMLVILSLAGYGFREVLQRYVVANSETDAINVSRALLAEERDKIVALRQDGGYGIEIPRSDLPRLDRHMRRFLAPFHIVKIKIYSTDFRIIYSTDTSIIGEVNSGNGRLRKALAGHYDSELERKESVQDLADERKFDVDVVETYIPVRDQNGRVIGSFEIYMDVTPYRFQLQSALSLFLGILMLILLLVFGLSYPFIRRGTKDIKKIQEMLRKESITDSLTGSFNKRHILQVAQREFSRGARRRNKGYSDGDVGFIMLDLDHFKHINDSYGHLAGDSVLNEVARRIGSSLRSYDAVGRFGGEEFLVVIPGSDLEQTRQVAQKIWMLVREEQFPVDGETISITASLGVSSSVEADGDCTEPIKRADQALYRAKSNGRDRVEI